MRKTAILPALMVGAGLLWSSTAFASAEDELSMYRFMRQACLQNPSQAGCIGFEKTSSETTPDRRRHPALRDRRGPANN